VLCLFAGLALIHQGGTRLKADDASGYWFVALSAALAVLGIFLVI